MNGTESQFPEGTALESQIAGRHRTGLVWRVLFQLSTVVGIIALTALLYNIINQAFGLVAVENVVEPEALVLNYHEARLLNAPNTVSSEDDSELAAGIAANPGSIGFFGYAYYEDNRETLNLLTVDGVPPTSATVEDGTYPLARPLFLYASPTAMQEKPQVAAFINYYLQNVNDVIGAIGYFPASEQALVGANEAWLEVNGLAELPAVRPADYQGEIVIAGSSTLFPLTEHIADMFREEGFQGEITVESVGTTAGFRRLCVGGTIDIANAGRPITPAESGACQALGGRPQEYRVGSDALAVVTNARNGFLDDVAIEELGQIFVEEGSWSGVDEQWPEQPILRFIPGKDSGTLDFFAETAFPEELADLPKDVLVGILAANVSDGVGRRLEREQRFFENGLVFESAQTYQEICAGDDPPDGCTKPARSQDDVYRVVLQRVVQPKTRETWSLVDSLFNEEQVLAEAKLEYPDAEVYFRSWLTSSFVTTPQDPDPEVAGVRTAILGSLWVIAITILFSFPIGVGAAIYLEEYARENRINRFIQTNINNLAGVPSIIYGMLGLAIFVRVLEAFSSGAAFGAVGPSTTANGRTVISAGLTLGLLILPIIIINAQEAIRAVPPSLRQASYGLGATKWQTVWAHVLPNALPGILTGTILSVSRAIGETAPLVVVGASTYITVDPDGPFSKFTTLPIQIFQWTSRPQAEFRNIAAAAIVVLLILLLTLNASAVVLRNRYSERLT